MVDTLGTIRELVSWKGAWATKALFDDTVRRYLDGEAYDIDLINYVAKNSSGMSATRNLIKLSELTQLNFDFDVSKSINGVRHLVNLEQVSERYPIGSVSEIWLEKLCFHLQIPRRKLGSTIKQLNDSEPAPKTNAFSLINSWSFPILKKMHDIELETDVFVDYIERPQAEICWRRWYLSKTGNLVLFETENKTFLKSSQWLVWRLIHDATHLLHLSLYPNSGSPLEPHWLATMESFAMLSERKFLDMLSENELNLFVPRPSDYYFNPYNIKTRLLLGLAERALRLDYDLAVHGLGQPVDLWIDSTCRRTGLDRSSLEFAYEFHGMPGFAASYMLGMEALEGSVDLVDVVSGKESLNLLPPVVIDQFSKCDLTDIPSKIPQHDIYVSSVGITNTYGKFNLDHPFGHNVLNVISPIELSVSLSGEQRGIHMSRLQEVIVSLDDTECWYDLLDVSHYLARKAKELQQSNEAAAQVQLLTLFDSYNVMSGTKNFNPIKLEAQTTITGNTVLHKRTVSVTVMTACPCTLEYSSLRMKAELEEYLPSLSASLLTRLPPTFTHSQPGQVVVSVTSEAKPLAFRKLYEAIASVAHICSSVLKRPDEHKLIEKSHQNTQFCEDLCRNVSVVVASELDANDLVEVRVNMDESIHPHKVFARLQSKASSIWCESR